MPESRGLRGWIRRRLQQCALGSPDDGEVSISSLKAERGSICEHNAPPPPYQSPALPSSPAEQYKKPLYRRPTHWVRRRAKHLSPVRPAKYEATAEEAARAAVYAAITNSGNARVMKEPHLIAAHTAKAIALAVSTTRSYGAFVAVTAALETMLVIDGDDERDGVDFEITKKRLDTAMFAAMDAGLAADAKLASGGPWPRNIHKMPSLDPRAAANSTAPTSNLDASGASKKL